MTHGVPISLHGDGVPVKGVGKNWSQSLEIITWSSLLGVGSTLETCFYIFSVFHHLVVSDEHADTFLVFWRMLRWSLKALYDGTWPHTDAEGNPVRGADAAKAGKPLADGHFGVLWVVRGDFEWAWERLEICNYRALKQGPCAFCPCNSGTMPWTDFSADAIWKQHVYTAEHWHANHPDIIDIFTLPGASVLCYYGDMMHTKHLGTDSWFFGSVLWMLTYMILPDSAADNLHVVFDFIEAWYKAHPKARTVFTVMRLSMFTVPDAPSSTYPGLKGRAAEIRHLGPPLLAAWRHFSDSSDMVHRQVEMALACSVKMEEIVDKHVEVATLPPDAAKEFHDATFEFLILFTSLASHFLCLPVGRRRKLFNITIKCHYLAHIGLMAWSLNPRYGWCYSGEDMMQKTKDLMQSCLRGLGADSAPSKMLVKYMFGMHILMHENRSFLCD
jgi:hypothetical protein